MALLGAAAPEEASKPIQPSPNWWLTAHHFGVCFLKHVSSPGKPIFLLAFGQYHLCSALCEGHQQQRWAGLASVNPTQRGGRGRALAAGSWACSAWNQGALGGKWGEEKVSVKSLAASLLHQWRRQVGGLFFPPQSHSWLGLGWTSGKAGPLTPSCSSRHKAPAAMLHPPCLQPGPGKVEQGD